MIIARLIADDDADGFTLVERCLSESGRRRAEREQDCDQCCYFHGIFLRSIGVISWTSTPLLFHLRIYQPLESSVGVLRLAQDEREKIPEKKSVRAELVEALQ